MTIVDGGGRDDERFDNMFRKYFARVWRYFRVNRISDDEANDLAQDTFKRVFERLGDIRNENPGPFIATVAKTVLLNRIRARQTQKRSATIVEIDDPELLFEIAAPQIGDPVEAQQLRAQIAAAVSRLSEAQGECFRLWIGGHSYEEIAKILGISVDAVKSRLRDAKRSLREQLGETR
jgi:RNA polymerase sigma-70 factor (ECF subfamily)